MKHKITIEFETADLSEKQIDLVRRVSDECFVQLESLSDDHKHADQFGIHFENSKLSYINDLSDKVDEVILSDDKPKMPATIRAEMVDRLAKADANNRHQTSWRDHYHDSLDTFEACDDEELIENFESYVDMDDEENIKLVAGARLDQIVETVILNTEDNNE
jgi:hypothetical protein